MAEATSIEWCDHTFNPWRGCEEVHAGCDNCYARTMAKRNPAVLGKWGPDGTRVIASEAQWRLPLKWDEAAKQAGVRRRVFCASMSDVFEDWPGRIVDSHGYSMWWRSDKGIVDAGGTTLGYVRNDRVATMDDVRARLFKLIDATPYLDWILVTKRPENIRRMWPAGTLQPPIARMDYWLATGRDAPVTHNPAPYRHNVWLLTSISDQATADAMIPELLRCRDLVPVLGVSAEPLLGRVDIIQPMQDADEFLDWVIIGGESGSGSRPCRPEWIRGLITQCRDAFVPVFVKQVGSHVIDRNDAGFEREWNGDSHGWSESVTVDHDPHGFRENFQGADCRVRTRHKKGGDPNEWPTCLNVREFPEVTQ